MYASKIFALGHGESRAPVAMASGIIGGVLSRAQRRRQRRGTVLYGALRQAGAVGVTFIG